MKVITKIFGKTVEMSFAKYCYFIYGMGIIVGIKIAIIIFLILLLIKCLF